MFNNDEKMTFDALYAVDHPSVWGHAVRAVCISHNVKRFRALIEQLQSQAKDNGDLMASILGEAFPLVVALKKSGNEFKF